MKRFYFLLAAVFMAAVMNAQTVAVINDDNYYEEFEPVFTALLNNNYTADTINFNSIDTLTYDDIKDYDMIIWITGDDRLALNLWDTVSTPGSIKFYPALQQYYENHDGPIWIDGIDFLKPLVIHTNGSANDNDTIAQLLPITFAEGSFVHDTLGIAQWNYESKTMGDNGLPQYDKTDANTITTLDPVQWKWSTLWRGDGWTPVEGAISLYQMGPSDYAGAGYSGFIKYVHNNVTLYLSSLRLGKLGDGSNFDQSKVDQIVGEIVADAITTAPVIEIGGLQVNIYPNPATDVIHINGLERAMINISDITGRIIIKQEIQGNTDIDVSALPAGIYNLTFYADRYFVSQKIIVK